MGDVEIPGMQAADEALQQGDVCDVIFLRVDETDAVVNVIGQFLAKFHTNYAAGLALDSLVDIFDQLLGLAGAFQPHNYLNHWYLLLAAPACFIILPVLLRICNCFHGKFTERFWKIAPWNWR